MSVTRKPPRYNVPLVLDDMALRGWLPTHLARATGLSDQSISRFLRNEAQSAPTAKKIAEALGRSVKRYLIARATVKPRERSPRAHSEATS